MFYGTCVAEDIDGVGDNGSGDVTVVDVQSMFSGVTRNFVRGVVSTNSVEDRGQRERGSWGGSPLVRGSGGSCNLVQEISFHIVKFLLL